MLYPMILSPGSYFHGFVLLSTKEKGYFHTLEQVLTILSNNHDLWVRERKDVRRQELYDRGRRPGSTDEVGDVGQS